GCRQDEKERARFEAGIAGRRQSNFQQSNNQQQHQAPVIPHLTEKYDPDHPDADWGGFVQYSYKKRLYDDHASAKDNLAFDGKGGLMPDPSAAISNNAGRKLFEPHQVPSGDPNVPGIPYQSAVYQVGPGCDASSSNWKT
uniref:Uncharacterized protein n=1 Tax=Globisporangium ultimum (strain ATCC 200006 / CBS 805.95 / DAOM BR144) TaxID=431595 RepID=K3WAR3_GLOUD